MACEWRVLRLFFSPLASLPPPVKPSDNSGADRLARNKERRRGEEGEFDSFFKSGTKYPPLFLPLCVSLSSHCISLFTVAQFIFHCLGIPHLKETSSSRTSWAFDGEPDSMSLHCGIRQPVIVLLHLQSFLQTSFFLNPSCTASVWNERREGEEKRVTSYQHLR